MKDAERIQWQPWGAEAFSAARRQSKPIFLSISAVWCHWCHVMDQESFDHPEVIRRISRDFIPIRVDSDKRPDIDSRYNMGGWPTVAILDRDGQIIVGETYLPPGQLLQMMSVIEKGLPPKQVERLRRQDPQESTEAAPLDEAMVRTVAGHLSRVFDPEFGGFGGPPKFPQPYALELSFHLYHRTGDRQWLDRASITLDTMQNSGIFDPIDGGFFRYATGGDWDNPHYEKLLEANARMLSVYLQAYRLTGQTPYRATVQRILNYLFTTLAVEGHAGFCGSQAADGEYYTQSEEDRMGSASPPLDRTLYTGPNAVTASALLSSYHGLGDSKYLDTALKLIEFLWVHCRRPERGMFHEGGERPSLVGYLSDQVRMITALMDAFETVGVTRYLEQAQDLLGTMDRCLWDSQGAGYWDIPEDSDREGILKVRIKPFTDNAAAAMALTRLFYLTGQPVYRERAEATLRYLSTVFKPYKHHAAPFALALERFLSVK